MTQDLHARLEMKSKAIHRLEVKLSKVWQFQVILIAQSWSYSHGLIKGSCQAQQELGNAALPSEEELDISKTADSSRLFIHFYFLLLGALPTYWLLHQPAVPAVSRKFAWSLILPVSSLVQRILVCICLAHKSLAHISFNLAFLHC